jgi:hypothetical protein
MKTLRLSTRSKAVRSLLEKARKQAVVVQTTDGSEFMVTAIDDFDREIAAQRRNKKLMAYLDECAKETELIPLEDARRRLGLAMDGGKTSKKKSPRKPNKG